MVDGNQISFGSRGEAQAVASSGWGSDDHFAEIDAQFDSLDDGGDDDNGGKYICSTMVHLGKWRMSREFTLMANWHRKQCSLWQKGYTTYGKWVAKNLVSKHEFFQDLAQEFYEHRVRGRNSL